MAEVGQAKSMPSIYLQKSGLPIFVKILMANIEWNLLQARCSSRFSFVQAANETTYASIRIRLLSVRKVVIEGLACQLPSRYNLP